MPQIVAESTGVSCSSSRELLGKNYAYYENAFRLESEEAPP